MVPTSRSDYVADLDRNCITFYNEVWPIPKVLQMLWEAILDLAYADWQRTKLLIRRFLARIMVFFNKFDILWNITPLFGTRDGLQIRWNNIKPPMGSFS